MTYEEVDAIARGHVYSGADALEIGLIDSFGGLDEAVEMAAVEADIETYRIVKLPEVEDPFQKLLKEFTGTAKLEVLENELGENYYYYKKLQEIQSMKGIQARMPFGIRVR